MTDYRRLRVALLGAGAVGSQVASLLRQHADELADRAGARLELIGIAVRDVDAPRDVDLPRELLTTDAESLIVGADIVIELMGGIEPARTHLLQAINSGADVVTANTALLATHGPEIFDAADQVGAEVYYEAAAAGAPAGPCLPGPARPAPTPSTGSPRNRSTSTSRPLTARAGRGPSRGSTG